MNREFEIWVRLRYGGRYDLTRDGHGYYAGKWLSGCMRRGATVVA
jgi:hypothetical protein